MTHPYKVLLKIKKSSIGGPAILKKKIKQALFHLYDLGVPVEMVFVFAVLQSIKFVRIDLCKRFSVHYCSCATQLWLVRILFERFYRSAANGWPAPSL